MSEKAINSNGNAAFRGTIKGTGLDNNNNAGIWYDEGSGVSLIASSGVQAPGFDAGVNFIFTQTSILNRDVALNDLGQLAFTALVTEFTEPGFHTEGIWRRDNANEGLQIAYRDGDTVLGSPDTLFGFSDVVLNSQGRLAFKAGLRDPNGIHYGVGLFAEDENGVLTRILGAGDQVDVDNGPGIDLRTGTRPR